MPEQGGRSNPQRQAGPGNNKAAKPASYVVHVSECGSVGARGVYRPTGKKRNSQPILKNENGFTLSREKLDTIGWIIGKKVGGMHCAHYAVASKELEPPVDGWKAFEGAEPLPMLIVKHSTPTGAAPASATVSAAAAASAAHRARPPQPAVATMNSVGSSVETENSRQRNRLYERVIYTERDYGTFLSKILSFVVEPMRVARSALKGFEDLIACFTDVLESHSTILSYIHRRVETRPSQVISGVFIEHVASLRSYVKYFVQYPAFLAAARKCLGDMRTLGADATFRGATLPVILFRPVLRLFEYEFFLRNLLHFTDREHQFHSSFQKAHSFVLSALKELQAVMGKDTGHHVGDLMKVCAQLQMPSVILPGRRYNSTWAVLRCSVGGASDELVGAADMHVFTDMVCLVPDATKPATAAAAARRDTLLAPEVTLYHCDLTAVKLLPGSPAGKQQQKKKGGAGGGGTGTGTGPEDPRAAATVSIHLNDAFRKAPRVYNLLFAHREEAADFVLAFEALLRAPEVKFGLPAPEASYPTAKFFVAPPPPAGGGGRGGGKSGGAAGKGKGAAAAGRAGGGKAKNNKAPAPDPGKPPGRTRNWASHRKPAAGAAGAGAGARAGAGDFKAAVEHKKKKNTTQQRKASSGRRPGTGGSGTSGSTDSASSASGGMGESKAEKKAQAEQVLRAAFEAGGGAVADDDDDSAGGAAVAATAATAAKAGGTSKAERRKDCLYRLHIYRELISTEQTYVANLKVLVQEFKHGLRDQQLVDMVTLNQIFGTCEEILGVNTKLAGAILSAAVPAVAAQEGTATTGAVDPKAEAACAAVILQAFSDLLPYLKMYGTYCNSYPAALACVEEASRNSEKLRKFIEKKVKALGMNLDSYLILPAQRFCKYPLFFRDIVAHTPPDHPCYDDAVGVKQEIEARAREVNELVSNYQRRQRVAEIQQRVSGVDKLLKADRLYLNDFKLQLLRADGTGKEKWRKVTLFVFSDVLVVAKPDKALFAKKGTLKYMNLIRWEELDFAVPPEDAPEAVGEEALDLEFTATQAYETNTTVTNYKLRCKDAAQKRKVQAQFAELTDNRTRRSATLKKNQQVGVKQRKWGMSAKRATWRRGQKAEGTDGAAGGSGGAGGGGGGTAGSHASGTFGSLDIFNHYKEKGGGGGDGDADNAE